eukprot:4917649-Pyramimonas_sp.AAC.1
MAQPASPGGAARVAQAHRYRTQGPGVTRVVRATRCISPSVILGWNGPIRLRSRRRPGGAGRLVLPLVSSPGWSGQNCSRTRSKRA